MNRHLRGCLLLPLVISVAACTESSSENSSGLFRSASSVEMAVLGDSPYQPEEFAEFPELVASINADPFVTTAVHVGDIKAGSTPCLDQSFQNVFNLFQTFDDPLIYSIGDNEWTDCDRPSAGAFEPEERLDRLRQIFFSQPGNSLGGSPRQVEVQPNFPENQLWEEKGFVFGTLHVVGTNNNLTVGQESAVLQSQSGSTEYGRRTAANLAWMSGIFERAIQNQAAGVALFLHADMWKAVEEEFDEAEFGGFRQIVQQLSQEAEAFDRPVVILSGDNHRFRVDAGVPWFSRYDVSPASNITQVIVQQGVEYFSNSSRVRISWVRLIADASPEAPAVFQWDQMSRIYAVPVTAE